MGQSLRCAGGLNWNFGNWYRRYINMQQLTWAFVAKPKLGSLSGYQLS